MSSDKPKLSLTDLGFGFLNPVTDPTTGNMASRRRSTVFNFIQNSIQDLYASHALKGVDTFKGVVVFVGEKQVGLSSKKDQILEAYSTRGPNQSLVDLFSGDKVETVPVYKVYIPELEFRPAPLSFDDPVVLTYFDVYSEVGGTFGTDAELGSLVEVRFANLNNFAGATIVSVGKTIAFADFEGGSAKANHGRGASKSLGESGAGGGGGPPTPQSPAGLQYNEFRTGKPEWTAIQIHYTVTFNTQDAISVLAGRGLSYNYIIAKDGTVTMTVDPTKAAARHAGRGNPDQTRIGISFVNLGYDSKYAGGGWGGRTSPPLEEWESFPPTSLKWEPYTPAAIQAGKDLVKSLVKQFPDIQTIFGHEDTSARKLDPGPAFDRHWPAYEALLPAGRGSIARSIKERGSSIEEESSSNV